MRFKIEIDGKTRNACYIGRTFRLYREQFGKDLLLDVGETQTNFLKNALELINEKKLIASKDTETETDDTLDVTPIDIYQCYLEQGATFFEQFIWACLASAERSFPLYEDFLDSIENYPSFLFSAIDAFQIVTGNSSIVEPATPSSEEDGKKNSNIQKS